MPFSPLRWFWRLNYQLLSDSILSAAPLRSAWIRENLRKQRILKRTQFSIWKLAHSPYSGFFQCKELADGKYQSKVLEEGTSKDFGSQDKSFPEDTFWINLVRSSQQTFLWRYSPKENLQKALLMLLKKWKDESFSVFCLTGLKVHPTPQQKL